jgi:SEC-C motif-containing protein
LLEGKTKAATPEALMRSRYTAFCQGNIEYLIATHYPSQRQPDDAQTLQATVNETEWLGLTVISASQPNKTATTGFVEFAAFYKRPTFGQLHERSKFIRENEQWYYLNGELLPPITLGRNDLCWCGSGKKHKKCHGR